MNKKILPIILLILSTVTIIFSDSTENSSNVNIVKKGLYWDITIDLTNCSHYDAGKEYTEKCIEIIPGYEMLLDSFLSDIIQYYYMQAPEYSNIDIYQEFISRLDYFKTMLREEYLQELEGAASVLTTFDNIQGDGKISPDELFLISLVPDIVRLNQCSSFSVFGDLSIDNKTVIAKNNDFFKGFQNQVLNLHSVTTFKNGSKSLCSIGFAGILSIITGFNDNGLFATIQDSDILYPYDPINKSSYGFELRYALENYTNARDSAMYMIDTERDYAFNHLIIFSDKRESMVLENNCLIPSLRKIRLSDSQLNPGVLEWPEELYNAIGAVNSFITLGNIDNHTNIPVNELRWENLINEALGCTPGKIDYDEIKKIITFDDNDGPGNIYEGDLYNNLNYNTVIFTPETRKLDIAFVPQGTTLPEDPDFEDILVDFDTIECNYSTNQYWGIGFTGELKITNTMDVNIDNWFIEFDWDNEISSIWNGKIVKHIDNHYIISHSMYNSNIAPGENIVIGFTGESEGFIEKPSNLKTYYNQSDYSLFKFISKHGHNKKYVFTIKNNTDKMLNEWAVTFDSDIEIDEIYNAEIYSQDGNNYILKGIDNNISIAPGQCAVFVMILSCGTNDSKPNNFYVNELQNLINWENLTN